MSEEGKPEWTHVRVRVETRDRLRREVQLLVEAIEQGFTSDVGVDPEPINPRAEALSFDRMINLLLDHRARDRARRQRHKLKKQGQGGGGDDGEQA